jgi:iterative type I PKS product template protein
MFLSKTGGCKTFDANADGYCRADGVGTVVLKRLDDAEADNDNILAVILGTATNHSAEAISITHPHAGAQSYLYESILYAAGVDAHDISYIEMHGTGTQAGDKTEANSVMDVFAPRNRQRAPDNLLHMGAVKSNVGHGEAAAGITALVKMLLMLQKNTIPKHIGIKSTMNPAMPHDMKERNVRIAFENTPWMRQPGKKRVAFLNNFSAAGGNTGLLLEDAPELKPKAVVDPRSEHVVTVSAKSIASMKNNIQNLIEYLGQNPRTDLADLAYTTTARRAHFTYRVAVTASDISEVVTKLSATVGQTFSPISSTQPKVAFVFTGQGAFYPALGKALYQDSGSFRGHIQQMNSMAQNAGFPSIIPAIDGSGALLPPVVTQLSLCCIQMALTKLWNSFGIKPSVVIGHSLGEYAALNAAGVLSVSDTINLVGQRAKLLEEKCVEGLHAMLAVKGTLSSIYQAAQGKPFEVACINGKQEIVLCGTVGQIVSLSETLKQAGLKCMKLDVPYAFHSSQVEPILELFNEVAHGATFHAPKVPVISPLLGSVVTEAGIFNAEYLCRHARESVNFLGALQEAESAEVVNDKTVWIELGPHPICNNMIQSSIPPMNLALASLRKSEDPWKTIAASLASLYRGGLRLDWAEVHRDFDNAHRLILTPLYAFDEKNHWIQYEGDWALTKGQTPAIASPPAAPVVAEPVISKLSTTSVHRIVEEKFDGMIGKVVVETDITEPTLNKAVTGHLVNNAGLCPSSIYADMALTIANYLYKELVPGDWKIHMDVCNMEVPKSLIGKKGAKEPQLIHVTATTDLTTGQAEVNYHSVDASGKQATHHAHCIVKYGGGEEWLSEWSQIAYLVKGRIRFLQKSVGKGVAQRLSRGTAYKLFASLVNYSPPYRGMEEVIVDAAELEATSVVKFQTTEKDGNFFLSPYWIDSLAHLSGFIMNGTEATDADSVFVSHGWRSMRFSKAINATTTYRAYVKMQEAGKNVFAGDIYILEDDVIIGVVGGLKFQRIPRRVLDTLLPPDNGRVAARPAPKSAVPAASARSAPRNPPTKPVAKAAPVVKAVAKAAPKPAAKAPARSSSLVTSAMALVSSESEMDMSELQDECVFADIGIDSLLSLTIAGKFREELGVDVPGDLFLKYPTVKALKAHLASQDTGAADAPEEKEEEVVQITSQASASSASDGTATPWTMMSSGGSDTEEAVLSPEDDELLDMIKVTISEQMGMPVEEIAGGVDLGSLGMDSLMTISILGSLREESGQNLPSSFFQDYPTMDDIEKHLRKSKAPSAAPKVSSSNANYPKAQSILLQGNPKTAERVLFLIPDGSGSATSYATIPQISNNIALFGLNCPFMTTPTQYTCGIEKVAELFLEEVRRRQPKGPYYLGGWSAGGVIAYQMVLHLIAQGEKCENLILFDSPCPVRLEALPHRLHEFFGSVGLLGSGGKAPPEWLLPHFDYSIKALTEYMPKAIDPAKSPKVFAIWATDGVCKNPSDPRPPPQADDSKSMKWLLENRTDFGYNGWDQILPAAQITCTTFEGVNQYVTLQAIFKKTLTSRSFTMMREPQVKKLAPLIKKGLGM